MDLSFEKVENLSKSIKVIVSKNHTFGTDTILLADFSMPKKHEIALEIGTGCGAIPFYWYSFSGPKFTTAIDIQKEACSMVERSMEINNLKDKMEVICADIRGPIDGLKLEGYNLVVCNPPYKASNCGPVSVSKERRIARHEHECTIDDVTKFAYRVLCYGGRLCMCQRFERLCDVIVSMRKANIEPKKIRLVQQRNNSVPKLFLIEGKKGAKPGILGMSTLLIEDELGNISEEMKRIYKFYGEDKYGR